MPQGENEAYLDRRSGKIYWHSEFGENDEKLPDDNDDEKYISILGKRELGAPIVFSLSLLSVMQSLVVMTMDEMERAPTRHWDRPEHRLSTPIGSGGAR